jgi:hypothetical protein
MKAIKEVLMLLAITTLGAFILSDVRCNSHPEEYTPKDFTHIDPADLKFRPFRNGIDDNYSAGEKVQWKFFVVGFAKNPDRVVIRRSDGPFFSALNPKGIALEKGMYVRLNEKKYYTGDNWETAYLEITSAK